MKVNIAKIHLKFTMNNKSKQKSHTDVAPKISKKSKELGRVLGLDGTFDILYMLDEKPRQYKDLDAHIDFSQTSLSRRLTILQSLDIIKKRPIRLKKRKTNVYTLTIRGEDLMKFIVSWEKEMKLHLEQQKIHNTKKNK